MNKTINCNVDSPFPITGPDELLKTIIDEIKALVKAWKDQRKWLPGRPSSPLLA